MAKQVELKDIVRIEGDLTKLNDENRLLLTLVVDQIEYRVAVPDQSITTQNDVKQVITKALLRLRKGRKIENLSEVWKGGYSI